MGTDKSEADRRLAVPALLALILIVGVSLRLSLILREPFRAANSDEAVSGIMAMHILEGREWPIFYYGQAYGGAVQSYLAALLFSVAGPSAVGLKIVSLLFFVLFCLALFCYARDRAGGGAALVACAFIALPPPFFTQHSIRADGLYPPMLFFGTMVLLLAGRVSRPGAGWKSLTLLGLFAGLALWTHLLSVVYLIPVFLTLGLRMGPRRLGRSLLPIGIGALPGLLPPLVYNISHWGASAKFLGGRIGSVAAPGRLWDAFADEAPTLLGMRDYLEPIRFYPMVSWLGAFVWLGCVALYLHRGLGLRRKDRRWVLDRERIDPGALLLVVLPCTVALSGFPSFTTSPRYLTPLYSVLPVALGFAAVFLWRRMKGRGMGIVIGGLAILAVLHTLGNLDLWKAGLLWRDRDEDHDEIIRVLRKRQVRHLFTNYWIGYRLHLETQGEVIPSPFLIHTGREFPCVERYPAFTQEVRAQDHSNYLLWRDVDTIFGPLVETYAADYQKKVVGPFVLYTDVVARGNIGAPGILIRDKSGMHVRLPEGERGSPALLDGDAETVWRSRGLQRAGMALDLILPEAWALSGIDTTLLIHPV
ncbi:MAG: glycosyltransferase family 39 protein, partial [Planctomycetota bacterium]|nr:glycosyltransferase family 39 protein [Planctomycetota bacterium]